MKTETLIYGVSRIVAEKCVNGLFNLCGGINARFTIANHNDTDFSYNVYTEDKLTKEKLHMAISFCKGINWSLN